MGGLSGSRSLTNRETKFHKIIRGLYDLIHVHLLGPVDRNN